MATVEDILKNGRNKKSFSPVKRRAWDFVDVSSPSQESQAKLNTDDISSQPTEIITANSSEPFCRILANTIPDQNNTQTVNETAYKQHTNNTQTTYKTEYETTDIQQDLPAKKENFSIKFEDKKSLLDDVDIKRAMHGLTGHQLTILDEFAHKIQCSNSNDYSVELALRDYANCLDMKLNTLRTSIDRLVKKRIVQRKGGITGRHGITILEMHSDIYRYYIEHIKSRANRVLKANSETTYKTAYETTYNKGLSSSRDNTTTIFSDWEKIDLILIQEVFKKLGGKPQTFGRKQLSLIFEKAGHLLTAEDVQKTLDHFAYGLKHFSDEARYASIKSPGGFLFNQLSAGDTWDEPRYLTAEEQSLHTVYFNVKCSIERDIDLHFERWINQDRDAKYDFYSRKIGSTSYYDDRVFMEMAMEDFEKDVWPKESQQYILQMMGVDKADLVARFESISAMSAEEK